MENKRNWSYTITEGPHKGTTLFSGRYVAVVPCVFKTDENTGEISVLANKRGSDTPNPEYRGKWNLPCGFLEPETGEEACSRETYEECGLKINPSKFEFFNLVTDPKNDKNVGLRYITGQGGDHRRWRGGFQRSPHGHRPACRRDHTRQQHRHPAPSRQRVPRGSQGGLLQSRDSGAPPAGGGSGHRRRAGTGRHCAKTCQP